MVGKGALLGFVIFFLAYGLIAWAGFRWALARVNGLARDVAAALERLGARVLDTRPSAHIWKPAQVDFELSGRKARAEVRQWGRDTKLVSVHIDSRPLPALWIRRERGLDRMGKAMGLEREVELGDAEFDQAVFITSGTSDAVVRELLASAEVRRAVLDVIERGYSVVMSQEGLRAATLTGFWSGFDATGVLGAMELLERLAAALPATDPALASSFRTPRSPILVIFPVMIASMATMFLLVAGLRDVVHPPIDNGHVVMALLFGLLLSFPAVYLGARMLRNRPLAVIEAIFVGIALLASVPFAGAYLLFAANSQLDHAAATHRRVHVLDYYKHNRHTVWVDSWVPGTEREKLIVPPSIPIVSIGDTLEFDAHPGAIGWTWVTNVRRVE